MPDDYKEVRFDIWCKKCKYKDLKDNLDPCCECLDYCMNHRTTKPVNFKEKD